MLSLRSELFENTVVLNNYTEILRQQTFFRLFRTTITVDQLMMMAPVYVACRLTSLLLCVVSVFLSMSNCYSPLVYHRQLLLDIKDSVVTTYNSELASSVVRSQSCFPNYILDIPDYLRRWHPVISRRKRRRRRGKRGGVAVKLKMELRTGHVSSFFRMTQNLGGGRCAVWRSLDLPAPWLRPIHLDFPSTTSHYSPLRVRRGGVNVQNLHSFNRASTPVISPPPTTACSSRLHIF